MQYQAIDSKGSYRGMPRDSFDAAETDAAIARTAAAWPTIEVKAICPNCGQWRWDGDCFNECAKRGFAPQAGPDTLNL